MRACPNSLGDVMHLVYYDHRGNGCSGRPPSETITFEQLCADALREHLGFEKSGHFAFVEEPDTFFDVVRGGLGRTS